MVCKYCGNKIRSKARYCQACGKPVQYDQTPSGKNAGSGKSSAALIAGISLAVIGTLLIGIVSLTVVDKMIKNHLSSDALGNSILTAMESTENLSPGSQKPDGTVTLISETESSETETDSGSEEASGIYIESDLFQGTSTSEINSLSDEIREEAMNEAANLAESGDYAGAIQSINKAMSDVREDPELTEKLQVYEDAYVEQVIQESNELTGAEDYYPALALVNEALTVLPSNEKLKEQREVVIAMVPQKFMDVCAPYQEENAKDYTDESAFSMGGENYKDGITVKADSGWFLSNLQSQYSELQFYLGHVDDSTMLDATVDIYLDEILYTSYTVSCFSLPQLITVPVNGINQLKVMVTRTQNKGWYYPQIGFGNMTIK